MTIKQGPQAAGAEADHLLTINEVVAIVRLSKSTVRRYVAANVFPQPVVQGPPNATGGRVQRWWRSEIDAYLAGLERGKGRATA